MVPTEEVIFHMHILVLYQGVYGRRIADNLKLRVPANWQLKMLELPKALPVIIDDPEEFLPADFPRPIWCCTWPKPHPQPSFCRVQSN